MEKINLTVEVANDADMSETNDKEVRTLKDLEMVLVGGGSDGVVTW